MRLRYLGYAGFIAIGMGLAALPVFGAATVTSFPSTMAAFVAIHNLLAGTLTVSGTVSTSPLAVAIAATTTTLSANTSAQLVNTAASQPRKSICIHNTGAGRVNLNFGGAATVGTGIALESGGSAGAQGGGYCWTDAVPTDAIHGISAAGTTVAVTVGN